MPQCRSKSSSKTTTATTATATVAYLGQIVLHGRPREQDASLDGQTVQGARGLIVGIFEAMRFVAHHQVATVGILLEALHVRANAFVRRNENAKEFGLAKGVNVLFDRFAIGFGQRQRLDAVRPRARSEPLDKFIVPILDEGTGTYDNDPLGRGLAIGRNASFKQRVDQSDGLQRLSEA